jgi:glycosyltransferase involved in cell wall biosynthesis
VRVLVDDSAAVYQGAGIGRYAREVVRAAIAADDRMGWTLAWAGGTGAPPPFLDDAFGGLPGPPRVETRRIPVPERWAIRAWHRARVPLPIQWLARRRADVVYSPDLAVAPSGRVPRVPTIHDLAFRVRPDLYPPALLRYLDAITDRQLAAATHIVTVSEATRADLIERARVSPDRISIVPNGIDRRFLVAVPPDDGARVRLGLPADYLLTVGSIEPRKNHLGLFAALDALPIADRLPLVVAGRTGWGNDRIMAEIHRRVAIGQVIFLPGVDDALLPALYAGAAATIYPALYEGAGIPVLESMATGTPVVVHDTPALRETAGAFGIVADGTDPEALAAAITEAVQPDSRDNRVEARKWVSGREWAASGRDLIDVLRCLA